MKLRMPERRKLWGANLCCYVTDVLVVGSGAWPAMWDSWDWDGWIRPQIDYMIGNGVGCNAIRVQGAAYAVQNGTLDMGQYLGRWSQLIEYCAQYGVYVYPCGCTLDTDTDMNLPADQMGAVFAQIFMHHQQYENVVGIDMIQETANWGAPTWTATIAKLAALIAVIKATGVTLPITCSSSEFVDSGFPWVLEAAPYLDFIDIHCYYHTVPAGALDSILAACPGKDIVVGEVGAEASWSTTAEQRRTIREVLDMANSGNPYVRGAFVWSSTDPANPAVITGKAWGQYDYDKVPRLDRLQLLRRFTGGSIEKCNSVH